MVLNLAALMVSRMADVSAAVMVLTKADGSAVESVALWAAWKVERKVVCLVALMALMMVVMMDKM